MNQACSLAMVSTSLYAFLRAARSWRRHDHVHQLVDARFLRRIGLRPAPDTTKCVSPVDRHTFCIIAGSGGTPLCRPSSIASYWKSEPEIGDERVEIDRRER